MCCIDAEARVNAQGRVIGAVAEKERFITNGRVAGARGVGKERDLTKGGV